MGTTDCYSDFRGSDVLKSSGYRSHCCDEGCQNILVHLREVGFADQNPEYNDRDRGTVWGSTTSHWAVPAHVAYVLPALRLLGCKVVISEDRARSSVFLEMDKADCPRHRSGTELEPYLPNTGSCDLWYNHCETNDDH